MPFLSSAWLCGLTVTSWCKAFFGGPIGTHLAVRSAGNGFFRTGIFGKAKSGHKLRRLLANDASNMAGRCQTPKPPNVLLYTGVRDTGGKKYEQLKDSLLKSLHKDNYVVYRLEEAHVLTQPWVENTQLLVVAGGCEITETVYGLFMDYLREGGRILSLCSGFCLEVEQKPSAETCQPHITAINTHPDVVCQAKSLEVLCEPFFYEFGEKDAHKVLAYSKASGKPMIIHIPEGTGTAVLSLVHLDLEMRGEAAETQGAKLKEANMMRQDLLSAVLQYLGMKCSSVRLPELTPAYLFTSKMDEQKLLASLQPLMKEGICRGKDLSLRFVYRGEVIPEATRDVLPVIVGGTEMLGNVFFDWQKYTSHLYTRVLGKVLLYSSVISSTQLVFDGNLSFVQNIPQDAGAVVVTSHQIRGRGRGGNMWLSPLGCMMFSLHVRVDFNTELGSRLPFLQHIASLAVVEAVRTLPGYEEINICLKWPNDIYFGRDVKIGGVIVTSSACNGRFSAVIGMGVNVSNTEPTICINDMIRRYNEEYETHLEPLCTEVLLARTVNLIEAMIDEFQKNGSKSFLTKYYKRWLHSNMQVTLNTDGKPEGVTIKGLDDFGFLLVQKQSGKLCSVQPDGNSFDMLRNLISIKCNQQ